MILVADSGSTKTQWGLIENGRGRMLTNTPGMNPTLLSQDEIETSIRPLMAELEKLRINTIYFFGAGVGSSDQKQKVEAALYNILKAPEINVESDLMGTCLALTRSTPAVVSILGTGSNSCLWDGEKISSQTPSLGYILGDEGGGVSIGKQLVSDFLKFQMPPLLRMKFSEQYDVSKEIVIERIYNMPLPNKYLASFAPFVEKYITHEYCYNLLYMQFSNFIQRNLLNYASVQPLRFHFCGSIAFHYQTILKEACNDFNLDLGTISKHYLPLLMDYLVKDATP